MKRYLPWIICCLGLLVGVSVGWVFGHTRPELSDQRKLLAEYQRLRDAFGLTDEEMSRIGALLPTLQTQMQRQDEYAAAMALAAFHRLEEGDTNKAKEVLAATIGTYYHTWRDDGGDTNVISRIEKYAAKYQVLASAISTNRNTKE
jgi:hypothetical protein